MEKAGTKFQNENLKIQEKVLKTEHFEETDRLSARWSYPPPPLGNFADIPYLKEQSFLHRIRDVCTLQVGA